MDKELGKEIWDDIVNGLWILAENNPKLMNHFQNNPDDLVKVTWAIMYMPSLADMQFGYHYHNETNLRSKLIMLNAAIQIANMECKGIIKKGEYEK